MTLRITEEEAMAVSDAEREANRRRQQAWRARPPVSEKLPPK
jgi:hypothetical protein